jgi:hypothetical protein
MCDNGCKVASKFVKHDFSRSAHPSYSPNISPCDCWLFGIWKGILKDKEFTSSDEIGDALTNVWNDFTFDYVQNAFPNWMRRLAWVIENDGEYLHE